MYICNMISGSLLISYCFFVGLLLFIVLLSTKTKCLTAKKLFLFEPV